MKSGFYYVIVLITALFTGCGGGSDEEFIPDDPNNSQNFDWIVDKSSLTGSDHPFPFAENPELSPVSVVSGLLEDDKVAVVHFEGETRAYPYRFIGTYEVVNDVIGDQKFAITYCPVTQSTVCVSNQFISNTFTYIASGFRYKDNLISLDASTDSYWSQMLLKCIKGKFENQFQEVLPMIETSWKNVQLYFPEAKVFTPSSISQKNAATSSKNSDDIEQNERPFGIIDTRNVNGTTVYVYRSIEFSGGITMKNNIIEETSTIIVGSATYDFITAFSVDDNSEFTIIENEFPVILQDNSGSKWNVFGSAISGPRMGEQLAVPKSYRAFWWAWEDFYTRFENID